jgi:hypothetical protein
MMKAMAKKNFHRCSKRSTPWRQKRKMLCLSRSSRSSPATLPAISQNSPPPSQRPRRRAGAPQTARDCDSTPSQPPFQETRAQKAASALQNFFKSDFVFLLTFLKKKKKKNSQCLSQLPLCSSPTRWARCSANAGVTRR